MKSPIKSREIRKAIASLAAAGVELTVFQQFALAATFDQVDFEQWASAARFEEQAASQQCIIHNHTDADTHTNAHTDNGSHAQGTGHWDQAPGHSQHSNAYGHTNNGTKGGHWDQAEYAQGYHVDEAAHQDKYNQANTHSNGPSHANSGYDHTNYVPSLPRFYSLAGQQISGTAKIALYSYDKNADGSGSQDSGSKTVLYTVSIRRIKNPDGTANVSAWRTLANNTVALDGKLVLDLDTIDPLGAGNTNPKTTEGTYEIQAVARNRLSNGVVQSSQTQTITVEIRQNQSPTVSVSNGSEFINFTFGFDGVLDASQIYKAYNEGLYADSEGQDGLLVRVSMTDADIGQYQRGRVVLRSPSGQQVAEVPITWSDSGISITRSDGQPKQGLAYLPKAEFTASGDMRDAMVVVEITDYLDSICTQPAGAVVQQTRVSASDPTPLAINVDVTKPTATAPVSSGWINSSTLAIAYTDLTSGIAVAEYQVGDSMDPRDGGWLPYYGPIPLATEGEVYVHWHAVDKVNLEQYGYWPIRIDRTPPVITATQTDIDADHIRIDITATDNLSGVKRIQRPDGSWVSGASASYTVAAATGSYTVKAEDNAGNVATLVVAVDPTPRATGLQLVGHVNAPKGLTLPMSAPVAVPIGVKAGYQMTLAVAVAAADTVQIRLYSGGQPVLMHTMTGASYVLEQPTGTRAPTTLYHAFWLDPTTPKGTVLSLEIAAIRNGSPAKTTVDATLGRNLMTVVGSSLIDGGVNQTR